MTTTRPTAFAGQPLATAAPLPVNLDKVDAHTFARTLAAAGLTGTPLLIDCGQLRSLRTLGVSHVVSQLLVLRRAGADVWLRNAPPLLLRCLALLRLNHRFRLV